MRRANLVALALITAVAVGCGGNSGKLDTVEVSGVVTYKGKPVAGATVVFQAGSGASSNTQGKTDGGGKFVFQASVGENQVSVSKLKGGDKEQSPDQAMQGMMSQMKGGGGGGGAGGGGGQKMSYGSNHELPQKYSQPSTSGLTANVSQSGSNQFNFDLQGEVTQGTSQPQGGGGGGGGPGGAGPGGPGGS